MCSNWRDVPLCCFHGSRALGGSPVYLDISCLTPCACLQNTNASTPCHCGHGNCYHSMEERPPAPSATLPRRGPCVATQCSGYQVCVILSFYCTIETHKL